jgi:hypothetical protein
MSQLLQLTRKKITNITLSASTIYPLGKDEANIQKPRSIDELILSIEDYSIVISNKIEFHPGLKSVNDLIGLSIQSIEESESSILIKTTNGMWLLIDLRPEAYFGPEALVLHGPNDVCVVWN